MSLTPKQNSVIKCEIVFATPQKQALLAIEVEQGTTALQAVALSGIANEFSDEDFSQPDLGIFSNPVAHDYVLREGDRVEIYRPLIADPKEVRRQLALLGKTMGSRTASDGDD